MRYRDNFIVLMLICARTEDQLHKVVQHAIEQAMHDYSQVQLALRLSNPLWLSSKGVCQQCGTLLYNTILHMQVP